MLKRGMIKKRMLRLKENLAREKKQKANAQLQAQSKG